MKNKRLAFLFAALALIVILAAAWHLNTRKEIAPGSLLVQHDGREITVNVDDLSPVHVHGEIVNGKGETMPVDASGVLVSDILKNAGVEEFTALTVVASDEYRAGLAAGEIYEDGRVWLTVQEDGSLRLIVFGDPDSKRNVTDAVRMEVQ